MKKFWAISAAGLSFAFVGSIAAGMAMAGDDQGTAKEQSLKSAAQGYYDAMVSGNALGMTAYFPKECQDDAGAVAFGAGMYKQVFEGVTKLRVTKVKVDGDRGEIVDGKIEGKVSDATKRLFDEDDSADDSKDAWQYVDGKWYTTCDATFGSASPTSTPSA